ncbi:MAG: ABC transporter permease [Vicinamibacterales bacterium]
MDTLRQDLRYACRRLLASPGFTAVAVLTLALGIGANSAIFSVINAVLLRPLPYPESDRLVGMYHIWEGTRQPMSPANFLDLRQQTRTLEDAAAIDPTEVTITGAGDPIRVDASEVSASFFGVLRAHPFLGRTFAPDENEPGKDKVVVLAHGLWQQRFGGRADIIGASVSLDGTPHTVIGVMPRGFSYPAGQSLWIPLEYTDRTRNARGAWYLRAVARLKTGVSAEQSAGEIALLGKALETQYPRANTGVGFNTYPLHEALVGNLRPALLVLIGAVGFVLLIACANVANLLLARAVARETELAVRRAVGAGPARLARQLLTESLVLSAAGGAAGLLVATWGAGLLVALQPEGIPRLNEVGIDSRVGMFTLGLSVLTGIVFGAIPTFQMTRGSLASSLKEGGRSQLAARGSARVRATLVVAEMALAVMLLAGAGLLIRSFGRLQSVDPGFRPESTVSFGLALPATTYKEPAQIAGFYDRLVERMRTLPGVRAAGGVMGLPLSGLSFNISFNVAGRPPAAPGQDQTMEVRVATPDYFRTLGIPLKKGRLFADSDTAQTPNVALLSEAAARRFFSTEDPIGKRVELGWGRGPGTPRAGGEIVGIVGDVREHGLDEDYPPEIYLPMRQWPVVRMTMVARTTVPPLGLAAELTQAVHDVDANLPVSNIRTVQDVVSESIAQPRFYMLLLATFAAVALVLAAIGIFGVMSYTVSQRTREIGIRMALGAQGGRVVSMVVGQAMLLAAAGLALGLAAALALSRTMTTLLFDLSPTDPMTFAIVAAVLALVAFLASYVPARRAAGVDPIQALRAE